MFKNRADAGAQLTKRLHRLKSSDGIIVYALPRGGIVPAAKVAEYLNAPLELIITRKIGHPQNPEYAICAVSEQGEPICNDTERALVDDEWFSGKLQEARQEARRRRKTYRGDKSILSAKNKTAIIVDDGIATGLTMKAAVNKIKSQNPKRIIIAVPVAPHDTAERFRNDKVEVVAVVEDESFQGAIGMYYQEWEQVQDEQVKSYLNQFESK